MHGDDLGYLLCELSALGWRLGQLILVWRKLVFTQQGDRTEPGMSFWSGQHGLPVIPAEFHALHKAIGTAFGIVVLLAPVSRRGPGRVDLARGSLEAGNDAVEVAHDHP
ncbi:MAG: hypothetical protein MO853_12295 [Candidatus Protistobacter heckmanni]|nr:hypothetical protein [Candidatus Protistobacter heckmanni]